VDGGEEADVGRDETPRTRAGKRPGKAARAPAAKQAAAKKPAKRR
jgi:hypothetical protein